MSTGGRSMKMHIKHRATPRVAVFASVVAGIAAMAPQPGSTQSDTSSLKGNSERGAALFRAYSCYACHGYTGETGSGARLNPPRFNQVGFIAYVRNPSTSYLRSGNMGGVMPPYAGEDVSDQDLADIFAFIESLPSTTPPLEDIDLLEDVAQD